MKLTKIAVLLICCFNIHSLPASVVYECTDSQGNRIYSQSSGKNCKRQDLGKPSVYTPLLANKPSETFSNQVHSQSLAEQQIAPTVSSANIEAAQIKLQEARRALEEGRKIRYGNERNYVRYQERIQGLENAVKEAEQNLTKHQNSK
ncbi:lipoic acid synthetase [Neisseria sp.]|uniref:lipoic acid synthetase n=1 Tax=Neisseria sp. TaxID=192066 RepID=UPI0035A0C72A